MVSRNEKRDILSLRANRWTSYDSQDEDNKEQYDEVIYETEDAKNWLRNEVEGGNNVGEQSQEHRGLTNPGKKKTLSGYQIREWAYRRINSLVSKNNLRLRSKIPDCMRLNSISINT